MQSHYTPIHTIQLAGNTAYVKVVKNFEGEDFVAGIYVANLAQCYESFPPKSKLYTYSHVVSG